MVWAQKKTTGKNLKIGPIKDLFRLRAYTKILWVGITHFFFQAFCFGVMQYKNDSIQPKIIPILKMCRFFTTYTEREKRGNFKIGTVF